MADTYSTQWKSPTQTNGEWRDVVTKGKYGVAKEALTDKVKARKWCRLIAHTGDETVTLEEMGPFNGPTPGDR